MEKRYLTIKDAMEYTSMKRDTLFRLFRNYGVKVYQEERGGLRFVDKLDIDKAFAKAKEKRNTSNNGYRHFVNWA